MNPAIWTVVIAAAAASSLAMGVRQTFGLFILPMAQENGLAPGMLGAAVALHNLTWGLMQPVTGALADRYGTGRVVAVGGACFVFGLGLAALFPTHLTILVGIGLFAGCGVACAGTGTTLAAVGRIAPPERRGDLIGLASAGGSLGQAALVPLVQTLIGDWGAAAAMGVLGLTAVLILPIARAVEWRPPARRAGNPATGLAGLPALARHALRDRGFALLTAGFFACGFQLAFLTTHLPTHIMLCGLPAGLGATALMLVGLFNIPGSWLCGRLSTRLQPELALGFIYLIRTVAIAWFALATPTYWGTVTFAAVMGFVWLGSIPLTSAAIARRFGVADLGALYGVCFFSHQVGGFLGAASGAVLLETTGSFAPFWPVMVVVGLSAVAFNWMVRPTAPPPTAAAA